MQPLHDASLHLAPSWESVEHALARASSPEAVHALLVHDLAEAASAVAASVALLDTTGEWVEVVTSRGYEPDVIRQLSRFRVDADLPLADAIRTDRVLVVSSPVEIVRRYSGVRPAQVAKRRRSIACIPIRFGGQTVGAVGLSFEVALDAAGPEVAAFEHLSTVIGSSLARASGWTSGAVALMIDAARSRLAFLSAATRELARSLEFEQVLDTLTQLVVPRFADWASVLLPEGHELVAATLVHRDHQHDDPRRRAGLFRCPIDAPTVSARVFRSGQAARVRGIDDDVRSRMAAYPELAPSLGATRERMVVPITSQGSILGVITLGSTGQARFDDDDLTVAVELADRAGTALEHATRYRAERTMVEVLQRAVLPSTLPTGDGYRVATRYLPSSVLAKVGGDWFDAFRLRDGRIGLCVGDVVGHGVEAAACMGQLRNALRAYALDGDEPAVVVGRLNAFTIDTHTTDFATLTYAIFEPESGALTWTSAGHPPPLCRRRTGVEVLPAGHGMPVGVTPTARYGEASTVLEPGEVLAVFTDGLVEAHRGALDAGIDCLLRELGSTEGQVEAVADRLLEAAGDDRSDDTCLVVLDRSDLDR